MQKMLALEVGLFSILFGMWNMQFGMCAVEQIQYPLTGEINTNGVNLRAGGSTNYEIVSKLNKGARVAVLGRVRGWYRIVPPAGVPFWVWGGYVQDGEVICNRLNVRPRPATKSTVICQLGRGEQVIQSEEHDGWLAIKAPECAVLWVSAELIDLLPMEEERGKDIEGERVVDQGGAAVDEAIDLAASEPPGKKKIPILCEGMLVRCKEISIEGARYCLMKGFFFKRVRCLLKSEMINLRYFENDRVKVWGYEVSRLPSGNPVIDVRKLEVE
jgi:SH3-like domain-containing protein